MRVPYPQPVVLGALRVKRLGSVTLDRLSLERGKPGRVHSVFERAINVVWCDGRLLTLQGGGPLAAPFAVALERLPPRGAVAPGMPIGRWVFDWRDAERVALEMPAGPLCFAADALPEPRCASALSAAAGLQVRSRLERGIAAGDARGFADAACAFVGLGEGLTPAGDDCVLGALATIHRLAPGWLAAHESQRVRLADAARRRTTDVARDFLLEALEGRFAEPVLAVLTARSDEMARSAAGRLAALGATSGADILCGIRLGCRALEVPSVPR